MNYAEAKLDALSAIIDEADTMRNMYSYYFRSPATAGARRSYELRHSHARVEWIDNGHTYSAEYIVQCSARNVYARGEYTRDGAVTTLTAIRNSYKRLAAAAEQF